MRSLWIRSSEPECLAMHSSARSDRFCLIRKPYWLSPVELRPDDCCAIPRDEFQAVMQEHFSRSTRPILAGRLERDGDDLIEADRLFIVPTTWPEIPLPGIDHDAVPG